VSDYRILGRTVDDAAGEAFDKVAKMLGLGYPGGPEIERCAAGGDPNRFDLPRSMLHSGDANFSFSGLKTAVRYLLPKLLVIPTEREGSHDATSELVRSLGVFAPMDDSVLRDLCASFQRAVVDVLVAKTVTAARAARRKLVTVSGGVSCNRELRAQMSLACERAGLELHFAEPQLCTDNAAMIAFAAMLRRERGEATPLTTEINPNLALA
jgi:N6-L-threonylcarbamoyladenine synthase